MAIPSNLEIEDADFVNAGKGKFNEAVKQLPVALTNDNGILTLALYKGVALTVDLTDIFPTRTEVAAQLLPGAGSTQTPGLLQLAHDDNPADLDSEVKPLSAAGTVRLLETYFSGGSGSSSQITLQTLFASAPDSVKLAIITALLSFVKNDSGAKALFCELVGTCNVVTPPTQVAPAPIFDSFEHFEFTPDSQPAGPNYRARFDQNTCTQNGQPGIISGWGVDVNNPNGSVTFDVYRDGVKVDTFVANQIDRDDVRLDLIQRGLIPAGSSYTKYGYIYPKPAASEDGLPHKWELKAGGVTVATSDTGALYETTCGASTAYPVQQVVIPPAFIPEGGTGTVKIRQFMSSGPDTYYAGAGAYSLDIPYPNGVTITTNPDATATITVPAECVTADVPVTVRFTFLSGASIKETTVIQNKNNPTVTEVTRVAYAYQKNNPAAGNPGNMDIYVATNSGLEMAVSYSGAAKSSYSGMNAGTWQTVYNRHIGNAGVYFGLQPKVYLRAPGTTVDVLVIDIPALPNNDVPFTQVYPVTN